MAGPLRSNQRKFTYRDYVGWAPDERWELIDGVAYDMRPAPAQRHQACSMELAGQFGKYFLEEGSAGETRAV